MTLVPYDSAKVQREYNQSYDESIPPIPIYSGSLYQKGHGLGNVFSSLMKVAMPLVKQGAKSLGQTALKTGLNIAKDTLSGGNFKTSLSNHMKNAGHELLGKAVNKLSRKPNKTRKRKAKPTTSKVKVKRRRTVAKDIFTN